MNADKAPADLKMQQCIVEGGDTWQEKGRTQKLFTVEVHSHCKKQVIKKLSTRNSIGSRCTRIHV